MKDKKKIGDVPALRTRKDANGMYYGLRKEHIPRCYRDRFAEVHPDFYHKMTDEEREYLARFNENERGRFYKDDFGPNPDQDTRRRIWRDMHGVKRDSFTVRHRDGNYTGADETVLQRLYAEFEDDNEMYDYEDNFLEKLDLRDKLKRIRGSYATAEIFTNGKPRKT